MRDPKKEIGDILRKARVDADKTKTKVANFLAVSLCTIVAWEEGYHFPASTQSRMEKICEIYRLNKEEFSQKLEEAKEEHKRILKLLRS